MTRPVCVNCGKQYGRRWLENSVIKHREGEPEPPYRGNGIVVSSRSRAVGMGSGSTGGFGFTPVEFGPGDVVVYRETWDGETYRGGYDPFCRLRCALDYARKAYEGRAIVTRSGNR